MSGHIVNDFKDLRSLITAVTKANPAKTTRQQNEKKMGIHKEDEAQPIDDKKPKEKKFHAGEEEIKRAYLNLGRAAQGSLEYQRKLLQKELAKMGFKTYSQFAFDAIFKFEQKDKKKKWKEPLKGFPGNEEIDENIQLESALSDMQDIVKTKGAKKIGGVMVDMFTASVITNAYNKVSDANKKKLETANLQTLVKLAHKIMGMKEELNLDEGKMSDLLIDIQQGATAKELARDFNISLATAKNFLKDYYGQKKGSRKEEVEESVNESNWGFVFYNKKSLDNFLKDPYIKSVTKNVTIDKAKFRGGKSGFDVGIESDADLGLNPLAKKVDAIKKKYGKPGVDYAHVEHDGESISEGTWAVPDSYKKLYNLQVGFLAMKKAATELNSRKLLVDLYSIFGDDSFYDDVEKYIDTPDPKFDLRDLIVKHLTPFGLKFNSSYKITHAPKDWIDNLGKSESKIEERLIEGKPRRGRGNIKRPKGKVVPLTMSKEDKLKEQKEQAQESPFKLKSQQYPRAVAINTDGFGKRHATVEDIIAACDSFGMILDKELQVEQIQKQLGKGGFISYKQVDLNDVFEERETQRIILTLESTVETQEPIEYTKYEITEAYIMGEEIEFVKPDGYKTAGPVLKKGGNTFNVKDKFTGKSFTYKYINEEQEVKTFTEVINEVSIGDAGIRKDFPNVWAQKDKRMNKILMALVNLHGYVDNLKSYKKDKKGFVDSLKRIGKNDAGLKKAGLTKREIGEDIQEGRFSKQLIKQAGGIAFDKRYYMGNMTGAINAIEKLKKGLSDDPKVKEMLRIANEGNETTDYTNWLPEGGDKEAYQKFFNAALKKFGVSSPDELEGDKKKEFFDYVDKNWKGDHEEKEQDVHKSYKMDGRRKNFKEKMRKLGYIKGR